MNELLDKNFDVAKNWCTTGVGVMPNDVAMRDYLRDNDWTYPIVARSGTDVSDMKAEIEEVYAIRDMILALEDPHACVEAMACADIKIVSLTITEFGYRVPLNASDFKLIERGLNGELDGEVPWDDDAPKPSTFGIICAAASLSEIKSDTPTIRRLGGPETTKYMKQVVAGGMPKLPAQCPAGSN